MARRKRTIIEELQPDLSLSEGAAETVPTEDDLQREEEIQNFVESFGGDVCRVSVYRLNKAGKLAYVGSLSPGAVTEALIQETYGEGEYNIRLLDEHGKFLRRRSIVIEGPRREPAPGPGPNSDGNRVQIEMLQQQMLRQHEMLLAMIQKGNNSGSSATELASALVQLRSLVKPTESKPTDSLESIRSAIELLNEGIKLAGKAPRGGGEGESKLETWRGILEAVPGIVSAVTTLRSGQTTGLQPAGAPPQGAPQPDPRIGEQPSPEQLAFMRQTLAYLKSKALAGKQVDLVIDWIADNLDEPPWLALTQQILAMPFAQLGSIDPDTQVEPLRNWFYQLYEGLKQVVEERTAQASSQNAGAEEGG
jgi:hypothetical protein